jgi:hypothetical protein
VNLRSLVVLSVHVGYIRFSRFALSFDSLPLCTIIGVCPGVCHSGCALPGALLTGRKGRM